VSEPVVGESLSRGMCILIAPNAALCQHLIASVALGDVVRLRKVFKVGHATTQPLVLHWYTVGYMHVNCKYSSMVASIMNMIVDTGWQCDTLYQTSDDTCIGDRHGEKAAMHVACSSTSCHIMLLYYVHVLN
jgi:hypothetical protein